jgi:DNA-binding transcriptional MerR regulator
MENSLPLIPAKRYFTIGEVADLCGVKPHVLRYWEQEFTQLRPMKRRGNRRYYQHHEVLMIRRIRDLLYDQGFTISGARNKMQELLTAVEHGQHINGDMPPEDDAGVEASDADDSQLGEFTDTEVAQVPSPATDPWQLLRRELFEIRDLLATAP